MSFQEEHFNSHDGMLTSIWGPPLWHSLHTISFNYPVNPTDEDKDNYKQFIMSLQNVLPCRYCRQNLQENLKKNHKLKKKHLKNRETFSRWMYDLHELINTQHNKVSGLSYEDVRSLYENFRARCVPKTIKENPSGCTDSLYGLKGKCVLKIIPKNKKETPSFSIDNKCIIQQKPKK